MNPYVLVGIFLAGFAAGWTGNDYRRDSLELQQIEKSEEMTKELASKTRLLEVAHAENKELREKKERVVTKEVIRYRASECLVPPEWVHIHNCSVSEAAGDSCGAPDASAEPVADNLTLEVVVQNYQICLEQFDKLKTLQAMLRGE